MTKRILVSAAAGALLVFPAIAMASETAFVTKHGGTGLSISRGENNLALRGQMPLAVKDRVVTGKDSFVEVRYIADGCVIRVANGNSLVIAKASPCAAEPESAKLDAQRAETEAAPAVITPAAADRDEIVADVTSKSGPRTLANVGEGLGDLKSGTRLQAGDTVFAGQESSVTLYFLDEKCEYVVEAETFLIIDDVAPCRAAGQVPEQETASTTTSAETGVALGLGAVAIGAGGVAVLLLSGDDGDDNDNPVTPN